MADEVLPRLTAPTEARNPRTVGIDQVPILALLHMLNAEDTLVPAAVAAVLPDLAAVVDVAARRIGAGGRMHYFGAGTSGRIAMMDAAEVIPTFGVPPGVVVAHHAGGNGALRTPREALEDSEQLGAEEAAETGPSDVVVGLSASGRTPYVRGALRRAREQGAFTVLVSSDPQASLAAHADVHLAVATGPEAIAGSTRLRKAATAQKLVLNSLSTAVMIRVRPHLVQPHGRVGGAQREAACPAGANPRGRDRRVVADLRDGADRSGGRSQDRPRRAAGPLLGTRRRGSAGGQRPRRPHGAGRPGLTR